MENLERVGFADVVGSRAPTSGVVGRLRRLSERETCKELVSTLSKPEATK
jgi:hypothetical protein